MRNMLLKVAVVAVVTTNGISAQAADKVGVQLDYVLYGNRPCFLRRQREGLFF